jgi:hypothetical protein
LPFQIISPPSINHIGANENNVWTFILRFSNNVRLL